MPLSVTLRDGITLDVEAAFYLAKEREFLDTVLGLAVFTSEFCRACDCHYRSVLTLELARAGDIHALASLFPLALDCVTKCDILLSQDVNYGMGDRLFPR